MRRLSGGLSNLEYLAATGLASDRLCAAHCVWVSETEQALLAERDVKVMHCPGSNLKLGSGIAPVVEMRQRGIWSRSAPTAPPATTASTCSTRCGSRPRCRRSGTRPAR